MEPEIIVKVMDNFRFLLYDDNINVQKKAYLAMISLFRTTVKVFIISFSKLILKN